MISFDKKNKVFHLTNGSISYYIYINSIGYLETLYFGEYIEDIENVNNIRKWPIDNGETRYFDINTNQDCVYEDVFKSGFARGELPTHGLVDKRGAPIIIEKSNGSYQNSYEYISHKIYQGIEPINDLPHTLNTNLAHTLEITLKEKYSEVYVVYYLTIFNDCDILVRNYKIINKSNEELKLIRAFSMCLDLPSKDYKLVHFPGRWGLERNYHINDLHDGTQEVSSNFGRSSHEENPFVYLQSKDATLDYGEVIGFNIIYSGNFKFRAHVNHFESTRILYGINDEDFRWILKPNSDFITPQVVISYSYSGVDKMSQNMHMFIKEHLITYKKDKEYKPILFNSWEGCTFNFTTDSIISYINDSLKIGSEIFVLDDGWFGVRNDEHSGLGDWFVNKNKIDLHKVINHCHSKNLKFGIWFEPEMVSPNSDLYRAHPDYVLGEPNQNLALGRYQFHLDFSNPEVVDNIYDQMVKIIDEYDIDYIKWDHNRSIFEHFSRNHDQDHQGEIYHRITLGYYSLIGRLVKKYPHIMFEGCCSGGGRFDLGTLFYTPQIWTSDNTDPIQRIFIQYNTSLGYPLSTISAHASDNKMACYKTKASIALFGGYGYEMNPNVLLESEIEELNEVAKIYKEYHKDVINNGVLYHLLSPNTDNKICLESISQDKTKALILFVNLFTEHDVYRFIKLKGLDKDKYYHNSFNNEVHKGDYYMKVGLNLTFYRFEEFTCKLIVLKEIK